MHVKWIVQVKLMCFKWLLDFLNCNLNQIFYLGKQNAVKYEFA